MRWDEQIRGPRIFLARPEKPEVQEGRNVLTAYPLPDLPRHRHFRIDAPLHPTVHTHTLILRDKSVL